MKIPDLDGIDCRVKNGVILDAGEVMLLTKIIRTLLKEREMPLFEQGESK